MSNHRNMLTLSDTAAERSFGRWAELRNTSATIHQSEGGFAISLPAQDRRMLAILSDKNGSIGTYKIRLFSYMVLAMSNQPRIHEREISLSKEQ